MPESAMPAYQDSAALFAPATPDSSESAMTTLYRAALGPVNAERYLPRFARLDTLGRIRPGWNWAACMCTLNWMALRHLWSAALVYVAAVEGLALLVFGVGRNLLQWPDAVQWGLIAAFAALAFVLPGLFGDAVLHAEIRKRIARALAATHTIPEACAQLSRQASSWKRLMGLALINLVLVGAASAAYWFLPQGSLTGGPPPAQTLPPASDPTPAPAASTASAPAPAATPASAPLPASSEPATPAASASLAASATSAVPAALPASAPASRVAPASATPPPPPSTAPAPVALPLTPPPSAAHPTAAPPPTKAANLPDSARAVPRRPRTAPAPTPPAASTPAPTPASPPASSAEAAASSPSADASAPPPTVGSTPGYYINVGLFAEEANARKAQARLLNEGLPAFRQALETAKGKRIRVRVGPYTTTKEANAAAAQIRALKLEAVVFKQ